MYTELPEESDMQNLLCESVAAYSRQYKQLSLFSEEVETSDDDIRVIELFAGVGGFRIGLERASRRFKTVWSNQWEPSTKRQDASIIYCRISMPGLFRSDYIEEVRWHRRQKRRPMVADSSYSERPSQSSEISHVGECRPTFRFAGFPARP